MMTKEEAKNLIKNKLEKSCYKDTEFMLYTAEAGWEDWMDEFIQDEEPTEKELKTLTEIQKEAWKEFWEAKNAKDPAYGGHYEARFYY